MSDQYSRSVTHLDIAGIWIDCSLREQHGMSAQCTQFPVEDGPNITDHVRLQPETLHIEGLVSNTPLEMPKSQADGAFFDTARTMLTDQDGLPISVSTPLYVTRQLEGEPIIGWINLLPTVGRVRLEDTLSRDYSRYQPRVKLQMGTTESKWVRQTLGMNALRWSFPEDSATRFARLSDGGTYDDPKLGVDRVNAVSVALRDTFRQRKPIKIITAFKVYRSAVLTDLSVTRDSNNAGALQFTAQAQVIEVVQLAHGTAQVDPAALRATPGKQKGTQATTPAKPGEVPDALKQDTSVLLKTIEGAQKPPPVPGQ